MESRELKQYYNEDAENESDIYSLKSLYSRAEGMKKMISDGRRPFFVNGKVLSKRKRKETEKYYNAIQLILNLIIIENKKY